jgi:MFS superfamily sulfate permease-like transporter
MSGASPFKPRRKESIVHRTFPVSKELPGYPRHSLRHDAIAGITVAAQALPAGS